MRISDWSSDVCSSDLGGVAIAHPVGGFLCVARTMLAERVDRPFGIALAGEIDAHQRLGTDEAAKIEKFVGADLAGLDPAPHQIVHRRARGPGADARSEEHTSELQSLMRNSYAVFCLKK